MTTPTLPAPVTTSSFNGVAVPADVQARIINLLVGGAPLASSFTRQPTSRSAVAWPTARPTGFAWIPEMGEFPLVDTGDDAYAVAVAKIGGIVDLSNEAWADNAINMSRELETVLRDSLSRDLDAGLLNGGGPPEPVGVLGVAPEAEGYDMLSAVLTARGSIGDAGGTATTLAASGAWFAAADGARDASSALLWPGGIASLTGLAPVVVPQLPVPLLYDATRCFLVVRQDAAVEMSTDYHFNLDATSVRIKARVAAAIPDPDKAIRKLTVAGAGPAAPAEPEAAKAPARTGTRKSTG